MENSQKEFRWKARAQVPVSAEIAYEAIMDLAKRLGKDDGLITPQELLDDSRAENAPLHKCFEWDDTVAAEKYRHHQASYILMNLERIPVATLADAPVIEQRTISRTEIESKPMFVRAFVHVHKEEESGFMPTENALQNDEYRKQVLNKAYDELRCFQTKYAVYEELSGVFKAIKEFADTLE